MTEFEIKRAALGALLWCAACDNAPASKPLATFEDDAGSESEGDPALAEAGAPPERHGPQFAVVSSDYSATSISLLGVDGEVLADDYLNSGSVQAGLVTALSGDVQLPTASGDDGVLVVIDRFKSDVITRIRLVDGKVLGQVKTHTPPTQDTDNAYSSNPHDYVRVAEDSAWVSRNQPNLEPDVPEIDRGNDLLRIDPSTMQRTDQRIDLSALDGTGTRIDPDTGKEQEVSVYARPSHLVRVGETLIVGLDRSAFDFTAFAEGMVAVVDLKGQTVEGLAIEGLKSCTRVLPIPGDAERVLVGCGGVYDQTRQTAGVAVLRVEDGHASVERSWRAQDHADRPALSESFVALSATRIAASANNYTGEAPSVFGMLDLESGEFSKLVSIPAGQGSFGTALFDADQQLLFVPDSSVDKDMRPTAGVHLLAQDGDGFTETRVIEVAKSTGMPARHVFRL